MKQPLAGEFPKIPCHQQIPKHQFREHFDLTFNCSFNFRHWNMECHLYFYDLPFVSIIQSFPSLDNL